MVQQNNPQKTKQVLCPSCTTIITKYTIKNVMLKISSSVVPIVIVGNMYE